MRGPEFGAIGYEVEDIREMRVCGGDETGHEGEEGNVAFMADVDALFEFVDCGVAVGGVLGGPVQVFDVGADGL